VLGWQICRTNEGTRNASSYRSSANYLEAAKKTKKAIYAISSAGMWTVSPMGVTMAFKSPTWFKDSEPQSFQATKMEHCG
jgi:hypothetical protein